MLNRIKNSIRNKKRKYEACKVYSDNYSFYVRTEGVDKAFREVEHLNWLISKRNHILKYFQDHPIEAEAYRHEIECLKMSLPYLMTCDVNDFLKKQAEIKKEIDTLAYDEDIKLYYLIRKGKRLYFKSSINSIAKVMEYYEYLAYEQTENSPHLYIDDTFGVDQDSVLVDCGAAEGIFALDNIDKVKKVYMFECDLGWIEALEATFRPYKEKVVIVPKYLGNKNDENMVTLDKYFEDQEVNFIKMDIEGYEEDVLSGSKKLLAKSKSLKLAIAAYHSQDAEKKILSYLSGFEISKSKGYLLHGWEIANPPFFRTGILRAEKGK